MQKAGKKSFFVAVVCLILCIALLVGTTFAWFTDSVSNTGNRIQAGTLDIDLLMDKMQNGTYVSVADGTGDIFTESGTGYKDGRANGVKWEPGKTEIVFLAVENKGSLALKYNIIIDAIDEGLLDTATGVSSLEYALIDGAKAEDLSQVKTWEEILAVPGVQHADVNAGRIVAAENGVMDEVLKGGDETEKQYFALAVHMKESAGNDYQGLDALIDVNITATQQTAETDGFDDDQYDYLATMPSIASPLNGWGTKSQTRDQSKQTADDMTIIVKNKSSEVVGNVEVPSSAVNGVLDDMLGPISEETSYTTLEDTLTLVLTIETTSVTTQNITLDVSMGAEAVRVIDGEETKNETANITELDEPVVFEVNLEANLKDVAVTHTHGTTTTEMTPAQSLALLENGQFYYESTTGVLTVKTDKFSEYNVTYTRENAVENETLVKSYVSLAEAFRDSDFADDNVIKLNASSDSVAVLDKNVVIKLNGNGLTNLTVNSSLELKSSGVLGIIAGINGCVSVNEGSHDNAVFGGTGQVLIGGGIYEDFSVLEGASPRITITGGKFRQDVSEYVDYAHYVSGPDTEGYYEVLAYETDKVAALNGVGYTTVQAALDAASAGDTVDMLAAVTEDISIHKDNVTLNFNGFTITGDMKIYSCDGVSAGGGSLLGQIIIGEHQLTKVRWVEDNYDEYYARYGYHPLAPATNVSLTDLNVDSGSEVCIYFTNVEDDLTRDGGDQLYGRYLYKTGYENKDQWLARDLDAICTPCSDTDTVNVIRGTYSGKAIAGHTVAGILTVNGSTCSGDSAGRYLADGNYLVGTSSNHFDAATAAPSEYTARVGNVYYTYAGGANDAVEYAEFGETVYIRENADREKVFGIDDVLTVVAEVSGISWTGASASEGYEIVETPDAENPDKTVYSTKIEVVARLYYTSDSRNPSKCATAEYKEYGTLAEAFAAAGRGNIIALMKDITLEQEGRYNGTYYGVTYSTGCGFDLNGHVITYTGSGAAILSTAKSGSSGAETVIMDSSNPSTGKIIATKGYCFGKMNKNSEWVSIRGGSYISENSYAIWTNNCHNLTIYSGTFQGKEYWIAKTEVETFEIKGGTFIPSQDAQTTASSCIAAGTLITMADGSVRPVEEISKSDMISTYSFDRGCVSSQKVAAIEKLEGQNVNRIDVRLSNGSSIAVMMSQAFFDMDGRKYFVIDASNAESCIGRSIMISDGSGISSAVIEDISVSETTADTYELITEDDYNFFGNGILTCEPFILSTNIFDIDDNYKTDKAAKAADISRYGLFEYEDFSQYMTEEEFDMFGAAYFKVALGKGLVTMDYIMDALSIYADSYSH